MLSYDTLTHSHSEANQKASIYWLKNLAYLCATNDSKQRGDESIFIEVQRSYSQLCLLLHSHLVLALYFSFSFPLKPKEEKRFG